MKLPWEDRHLVINCIKNKARLPLDKKVISQRWSFIINSTGQGCKDTSLKNRTLHLKPYQGFRGVLSGFLKSPCPGGSMVKNLPALRETWVQSLGQKDPLEKGMAPTLVFLPGEFQGQRSLAGYSPWGWKEWNTIERLIFHTCMKS